MNLSQILNPPSSAAPLPSTTTIAARPQDRVSSLPPHSVAASTAVLRLDSLSGTSPGARALKKQTTSVSKREGLPSAPSADFQEDTAAHSKLNSGKIKPNQVNNGYSTHTFRANMLPTKDAKDKDKVNGTTSTTILMSGAGTTPVSSGVGSFLTVAGGTSLQLVTKQHTSSSSTVRKRQRNQDMSPSHESASSLIQTQADSQEEQKRKLQKMQAQQEPKISDASAKKKSSQKTKLSSSTQTETDSQQPREIRFVMTEHTLKTSMDTSTTSSVTATATAPSSSRNTPTPKDSTEGILDQADPPQSPPTPDFEKNADGKYRCSWPRCGKEFTVVSRLTTHYRIHTGKPPYLCGYKDCQKAFHTSSSLSHHRVVHTDQSLRPYVCRHHRCGATYTQLARLITHQRATHSGMILFIPQESSNTASPSTSTSSPPDRSPVAKPEPSKGTGSSSKRKSGLVDIKPSISGESSTAIRSDIASSRNGSPREFTDYPEGTADGIDSESDDSDDMRQRNEAALAMAALHQPQSLYGSRPQTSTSPSPSYQYPRSGDYYHSQTTFSDSSPDVHRPRSPYSSNAPGFSYYSKPTAGTQEHPRDYSRPGGYGRIDAEPHPNGRTSWAPDTESHPRDNRYHPEGQHSRESMGNHDESRSV